MFVIVFKYEYALFSFRADSFVELRVVAVPGKRCDKNFFSDLLKLLKLSVFLIRTTELFELVISKMFLEHKFNISPPSEWLSKIFLFNILKMDGDFFIEALVLSLFLCICFSDILYDINIASKASRAKNSIPWSWINHRYF